MAVSLEFAVGRRESYNQAVFNLEAEFLTVPSCENAAAGAGIELGMKPNGLGTYGQLNRNGNSVSAPAAVVVSVLKPDGGCQALPPREIGFILALNVCHERDSLMSGNRCIDFPHGVPDRQQSVPIQCNPSPAILLLVNRQPFKLQSIALRAL